VSRLLRALARLACLLLVLGGLALTPSSASASSTILCRGYAGCAQLGMGNGGYAPVASTMYWQMYGGHNCTNYAAYRMIRSGLPNTRPWSGGGNAEYWGTSNAALTSATPRVGAVAWWGEYVRPAGASGHVAYVEQVISADEIVVSQDSWGGDFSWARITRAGGSWPSGFVHFNDVALRNTAAPAVTGTPRVGTALVAGPGAWTPSPTGYSYQWRADGVDVPSATTSTLTPTKALTGKRLSVRVTATRTGYPTTTALSASTAAVAPGSLTNTLAPAVTGEPRTDEPLAATPGQWNPAPSTLAFQWKADGVAVPGATSATFVPGPRQVGAAITVATTARKDGYAPVTATSAPTPDVAPGTITSAAGPQLRGDNRLGSTLTVDPGSYTPADATVAVSWLRDGLPVPGATTASYKLGTADLGHHLAVRVAVDKPGYTPLSLRTAGTSWVKTVPVVGATAIPGTTGRAKVAVTVASSGVSPVEGLVRIRHDGVLLGEVTLRAGAGSTTLAGLPSGTVNLRIRYTGGRTVVAGEVWRTVKVR
jgi:surface antigen